MAKTLKDLVLALLNATLLLLALCLFLGWKLASTLEGITTGFAEKLQILAPLQEQAQGIRDEIKGLRDELTLIHVNGDVLDSAVKLRVTTALDRLQETQDRLQSVQERFTDLSESPDELINNAIHTSADAIADRVIAIRECKPAS